MNKLHSLTVILFHLVFFLSAAQAETIVGTFSYADTDPYTGAATPRPIAFAKVEIHRYAPRFLGIWSWGLEATVTTNQNGFISVPMQFSANGVVYAVKVFATNYAAVVWPNDAIHTMPFHREPGEPGPIINRMVTSRNDVLKFDYEFKDSFTAQHYNLAETVRHGFDYANARRDPAETDVIPLANVQPTSLTLKSWYNPTVDSLMIASGDVFEDFLIVHEYAHFLEEQISSFAWIPANHDGCTATNSLGGVINSAEHAWMEGFADYFAQSVNQFLPPGTLTGKPRVGTPTVPILEGQPMTCPGLPTSFMPETVENIVAGTLWDLFDPPGNPAFPAEVHDFVARQDLAIFQIFDRELDINGTAPTILHFRDAWQNRRLDRAGLDRILSRHGILRPPLPRQTAEFIRQVVPLSMVAGRTYPVSITMRNTGLTTWSSGAGYKLGSQNPQDNTRWGVAHVSVSGATQPGDWATFTFTVTAPAVPGPYIFQWRMMQQAVEQFGDLTPNTRVMVVTSQPSVIINGPTQLETSRRELVSSIYSITPQALQEPLIVRWTADGMVIDPTEPATLIEFDPGQAAGVTVQRRVSVEVTDAAGVRVRDSKTVSIKIKPLPRVCIARPSLPECRN